VIAPNNEWSYIALYTEEGFHDASQPMDGIAKRSGGYLNCGSVAMVYRCALAVSFLFRFHFPPFDPFFFSSSSSIRFSFLLSSGNHGCVAKVDNVV
jgi:hypothetical protein